MSLALNSREPDGPSRLDLLFDRIATWAPFAAGFIAWVRKPSSRLVRIPLAFLLIFGGIFSFLPILGVWMLPLGFLILALDIPPLQGPVVSAIEWVEAKWTAWKNRKK
jgi:hypothetical protein